MIKNYNSTIDECRPKSNCDKYPKMEAKLLYNNEFILIFQKITHSTQFKMIDDQSHFLMINLLNVIDRCSEELEYCFNDIETIIVKSTRFIEESKSYLNQILLDTVYLERGKKHL